MLLKMELKTFKLELLKLGNQALCKCDFSDQDNHEGMYIEAESLLS